jgi:molecular chaperone GrpE
MDETKDPIKDEEVVVDEAESTLQENVEIDADLLANKLIINKLCSDLQNNTITIEEASKILQQCGATLDKIANSCNEVIRTKVDILRIQELERQLAESQDSYLRCVADMQNQQKRTQEDIKKSRDYAISSFAKDIIVVKDYLEMALKDQSGNIDAIKMGVDLTLKQLVQIFEKQKITEIVPNKADKLDPNLHQAINTIDVETQESNTIVDIMQKGYMLNDRVLRPAMVSVAK